MNHNVRSIAAVAELELQNFKIAQKMIKERKVESNVSAAIVGNTLLGAVHSCSRCKWLYWNDGEKQFDCGLGYLGKAVKDDLQQKNDCDDFEHCT
jgi:hypothetical protein